MEDEKRKKMKKTRLKSEVEMRFHSAKAVKIFVNNEPTKNVQI